MNTGLGMGFSGAMTMIDPPEITPLFLRELLAYDPETGVLVWKVRGRHLFTSDREHKRWNGRYGGKTAFSPNRNGYLDGMVFRQMQRAHRVAWAIYYGVWPTHDIDHINGVRTDNRISNLRSVDRRANSRNQKLRSTNKSGVMGVCRIRGRWRAYINVKRATHIGTYDTFDEAVEARRQAERRLGYHENHGRPQ